MYIRAHTNEYISCIPFSYTAVLISRICVVLPVLSKTPVSSLIHISTYRLKQIDVSSMVLVACDCDVVSSPPEFLKSCRAS